jgi:hypothetical protein
MKRFILTAIIAAVALGAASAGDTKGLFGSVSVGPKAGVMFYSGAIGIPAGIQLVAEIDRSIGPLAPFISMNILYAYTSASSHIEEDIYGTIGAGLRAHPFSSVASGTIPLSCFLGIDVGGGYTHDVYTTGRSAGVAGLLVEPNAGIEYSFGPVVLSLSSAYRCIFTTVTTKQSVVLAIGARYVFKGERK